MKNPKVYFHTAGSIIKRKLGQYLLIALVVGILASPFALIQLIEGSITYTRQLMRLDQYGHFTRLATPAQEETITPEALAEADAGLIRVFCSVRPQTSGSGFFLGEIDDAAATMLQIRVREGRMPENEGEVALTYENYMQMDQLVPVGGAIFLDTETPEGTVETKQYTLCGILYDFSRNWMTAFAGADTALLPTALTRNSSMTPMLSEVLYGESYLGGGKDIADNAFGAPEFFQNYFLLNGGMSEQDTITQTRRIILLARLLFLVIVALGCAVVAKTLYRQNVKTAFLMRSIGMSDGGIYGIFFLISLFISLCGAVFGVLSGVGLSVLVGSILRSMGVTFTSVVSMRDILISAVAIILILPTVFALEMFWVLRRSQKPQKRKKPRENKPYASFNQLYRKTIGKERARKMRFQTVLLYACVALFMFTLFFAKTLSRAFMEDEMKESSAMDCDYAFIPIGGGTQYEYLDTETHRDYGLYPEQVEELENDPNMTVPLTLTGEYATSFLHYDLNGGNPSYLDQLAGEKSFRTVNAESNPAPGEVLQLYGLSENDDLIDYKIYGIDYDQAKEYLKDNLEGEIHADAFAAGTEAIAFKDEDDEQGFSVGDSVTIDIFEFPANLIGDESMNARLTTKQVTISAVLTVKPGSNLLGSYLSQYATSEGLFISDDIMLEADHVQRYATVFVNLESDSSDADAAEAKLLDIYKDCRHGTYALRLYHDLKDQLLEDTKRYEAPFLCIAGVMILILIISYAFSTFAFYVANAKSTFMLKALGVNDRDNLTALFRNDLSRAGRSVIVVLIAALLCTVYSAIFSKELPGVWSFLLTSTLWGALFAAVLSLVLALVGVLVFQLWFRRQDLIKGLYTE